MSIGWDVNIKEQDSIYTCTAVSVPEYERNISTQIHTVLNINWKTLCNHTSVLNVVNLGSISEEVDPNQIVLSERQTTTNHITLHISSNSHKIPLIKGINAISNIILPNNENQNSGLIMQQEDDRYKTFSFVPFNNGKKIFSIFTKHNNMYYVTHVESCNVENNIKSTIVTNIDRFRNKVSPINQFDKVHCLAVSNKFLKLAESAKTVESLYNDILSQLYKTVDVNYMYKILTLLSTISFGK